MDTGKLHKRPCRADSVSRKTAVILVSRKEKWSLDVKTLVVQEGMERFLGSDRL
jgi:hypothetical protein